MNYPLYIGSYFQVLGWFSVASSLLSVLLLYWTDHLHLDASFLIWFWLGKELKNEKRIARKWAIGISSFILVVFVTASFPGESQAAFFGGVEYPVGSLGYFAIVGILFALLVIPGVLLLNPKAKKQFMK